MTQEEVAALDTKIQQLVRTQQGHTRDMRDALSQSSETWHDNAPRDVVLDAAKVSAQSLQALTKERTAAIIGAPEGNNDRVGLFTKFGLENLENSEVQHYQLTGSGNFLEIPEGVSCDSPLGREVF